MAAEKKVDTTGLLGWIDHRFPATVLWKRDVAEYYAPKNFNFWYIFGSLAMLVLVIQIVTGIFLVMHYKPDAEKAFASVEYIMRDVPWGWLVRYMHSTGASAFFIVVYLHMFRGLLYGSYRKPRELVWLFGCMIFMALMAEAFFGYLLPWGQMSYWGAQVIVNLFSALPVIGEDLSIWIRGDYVVGDATLNRFFSFHVIAIPLVLLGLAVAHIIAPVWYFTPFYSILRATTTEFLTYGLLPFLLVLLVFILKSARYTVSKLIGAVVILGMCGGFFLLDAKFWGVVAMGASTLIFFSLPWIDQSPVKSIRYRPLWHKAFYAVFVVAFLVLGYFGVQPPSPTAERLSQLCTLIYFGFFLFMPWWTQAGTFKQPPERVNFKPHH